MSTAHGLPNPYRPEKASSKRGSPAPIMEGAPLSFAKPPRRLRFNTNSIPKMMTGRPESTDHHAIGQNYAAIFSQSPGIARAWALPTQGSDSETLMVQRTARDLEGNKLRSYVQSFELSQKKWRRLSPFPLELAGAVVFSPSPSGKLLIVIKEDAASVNDSTKNDGYVIEVWESEGTLIEQISTTGVHGKVVGGRWFGGLSWSPDESKVVYVAQKKTAEARSFFSKPPADKDTSSVPQPGNQFLYQEDWGEKYDGVMQLGLFVADLGGTGKVEEIQGVADELTPGQPRFSKGGKYVVYTGWDCEPRKLGMIYCYQRPCNLYSAPMGALLAKMEEKNDGERDKVVAEEGLKPEEHKCLCPSWRLARSARFSPSGDRLVWLSREEGFDTHSGCFRLTCADWDEKEGTFVGTPRNLVDVVAVPETEGAFPGLWMDDLPGACWAPDGSCVYLTSAWGSRQSVLRVDAESGKVERVIAATAAAGQNPSSGKPEDASASVLAVGEGGVYVAGSSPNSPGGFAVLPFGGDADAVVVGPDVGGASITTSVRLSRSHVAEVKKALGGIQWTVISVPVPGVGGDDGDRQDGSQREGEKRPFEAILLMPHLVDEPRSLLRPFPLVVTPHGGPHGVMPTVFVPSYAFLVARGFAVLHVNFRGSIGFGTTALESLPGRIGTQDVADVLAATKAALALEPEALDPTRVGVLGGSHGGFLGAHMSAQHPDVFKVAVLRNPVTNIATMVTASDIPDWCYIEALGCGKYDFEKFRPPTAEELQIMWKASPVAHVDSVVAPTLITLGAKDRRVPQSQGLEWFHALKSKRVQTKLLVYPEDVHAIDKPASEADAWLNIVTWLNVHLVFNGMTL